MPDAHSTDGQTFPVKPEIAAKAHITAARYKDMFEHAARDPNGFWAEQSRRIAWMKAPTKIKNTSFAGDVSIKWFEDGTLNASVSCLDRHLATRGDQTAIIWESDDPSVSKHVTYRQLHEKVCRLANAMRGLGVKKGDVVTIYLPMVVEAAVAMLACARIGAIHSVVFGGFSPDSLANRIQDCGSDLLITADEGRRGGRKVPLKANADEALKPCPSVTNVIVVKVTGGDVAMQAGRDHDYATLCAAASPDCPPEEMSAEDPLFILYTSGSTGKPKGVLHTTGGYMVWACYTHETGVRLPPGRRLLVHRRCRLGHRPHLHRLRPAGERRDDADVRGRAELSRQQPVLAGRRQAPGEHLLHRANRDPRADARRRGTGEEDIPQIPAPARQRRRTDQPRGLALVSSRHRRASLPDRRYLVADRNRRHPDQSAARRHRAEARLRDAAAAWRASADRRWRRQRTARRDRRQSVPCPIPGPARCAPCSATTSGSC